MNFMEGNCGNRMAGKSVQKFAFHSEFVHVIVVQADVEAFLPF